MLKNREVMGVTPRHKELQTHSDFNPLHFHLTIAKV